MDQRALKREFDADLGRCYYCGGKQYVLLGAWYKHITKDHADTQRAVTLLEAVGEAPRTANAGEV